MGHCIKTKYGRLVLDAMGIDSKIKRTGLKSVDSKVRLYEFTTNIEDTYLQN